MFNRMRAGIRGKNLKRIKAILPIILAIACCSGLLAGCGSAPLELNSEKLSAELLDSGAFTDLLSPVDDDVFRPLYGIETGDMAEGSVFCGTGATAEEIAIFKAADVKAAGRLREAAENRVQNQILAFENYVPAEVPKLNHADIRQSDLYVVLVVSADDRRTRSVLDEYIK